MTDLPTSGGDGHRYRFGARIATGGMGEVWRATDTVLGREVAVKVLKSEYAGDAMFRSRFETEARNAAALHHVNVASVFDFGELPPGDDGGPGRAFLVMELVRGEPLSALLRGGERMPAATAADLLAQVADGLAAAHDLGIVHRDIKPGNLLVTPDRVVKITDFGIARAANAVALTQTGQVVGTPQYLSPEQAEGRQATAASDIYSLGVVLYECLAGRRPFTGDSPIATALAHLRDEPPPLPDDVPAAMRRTVGIALAKDPAARFATVRDFAAAMRGDALPTTGVPTGAVATVATPVDPAEPATAVAPATAAGGWEDTPHVIAPPPDDRDDRRDDRRDDQRDDRRGLPGWLTWVAVAAAVLLAVVVFAQLRSGDTTADDPGSGSTSPSSSGPTSAAPTRTPSRTAQVEVDEDDYLGRPRDQAASALRGLGLRVEQRSVANPDGEEQDTVAGVSPSGTLDAGSTVTLTYFAAAPTQSPSETPSETPSESTGESPGESPSESPSESSGDSPGESPGESPGPSDSAGASGNDTSKPGIPKPSKPSKTKGPKGQASSGTSTGTAEQGEGQG